MTNFRVSVKSFIIDENNKLLILKRDPNDVHKPSAWELPGGRLDLGEDPAEGIRRETKEETGLDVQVLNPLSIKHFTREDGQVITMIIFLCKPFSKSVILSKEHTEYDWMEIKKEKIADFFYPEIDTYLKHFNQSD